MIVANRSIHYGFRTRRAGRWARRGGVLALVAAGTGVAAQAVPTFIASRGRATGLPPDMLTKAKRVERTIRKTRLARYYNYVRTGLGNELDRAMGYKFPKAGRIFKVSSRMAKWAARHKLGARAWKLGKAGSVVAAIGAAGVGIGNHLIRTGYMAHRTKRQVKRLIGSAW